MAQQIEEGESTTIIVDDSYMNTDLSSWERKQQFADELIYGSESCFIVSNSLKEASDVISKLTEQGINLHDCEVIVSAAIAKANLTSRKRVARIYLDMRLRSDMENVFLLTQMMCFKEVIPVWI